MKKIISMMAVTLAAGLLCCSGCQNQSGKETESVQKEEAQKEAAFSEKDALKLVKDYWKAEWKESYDSIEVEVRKVVPYGTEYAIVADISGESNERNLFLTQTSGEQISLAKVANASMPLSSGLMINEVEASDAVILFGEVKDQHFGPDGTIDIKPVKMKLSFDDGSEKEYEVIGKEVFCNIEKPAKKVTGWELYDNAGKSILKSDSDDTTKNLVEEQNVSEIKK